MPTTAAPAARPSFASAWPRRWNDARTLAFVAALLWGGPATAHTEPSPEATLPWHGQWAFEPWVLACVAVAVVWYAIGALRLWRHAGPGRGVGRRQVLCFGGGIALLLLALVTPLDTLGARLFSAHMIQHEVLMIGAAPLLVIASPLALWAWALPFAWRRGAGRFFHCPGWRIPWCVLTSPPAAWTLHALALWLWHIPSWFDAALRSEAVHTLQHLSFFLSALVFWWSVLGTPARRRGGAALLSIFTTMVHTGALGAILTLARSPWYAAYAASTYPFGLTPLQDQQLGGVVMWVPAGFIYIVCGLHLAVQTLNRADSSGRVAGRVVR